MSSVSDRIFEAAEQHEPPIKPAALARAIGISSSAVYQWRNNPDVSLDGNNLIALAEVLEVDPVWLMTGRGPRRRSEFLQLHAFVPFFREGRVAAGHGAINDEYTNVGGLAFLRYSLATKELDPESCRAIRVDGDSMYPNIKNGDVVMYDTTDTGPIISGKIYVVHYGDEGGLVKRLFVEPDQSIIIRSDNQSPEYSDRRVVAGSSDLIVHGRVRWIGRWEG